MKSDHNNSIHKERYAKQIKVSYIGEEGQEKLAQGRVAIIGVGALGSVVAEQLVRAGVGYVRIIDRDFVEVSNLHRQVLYTEQDAEKLLPKVTAAANYLQMINSSITIEPIIADINNTNIEQLLHNIDVIVDGTDNVSTRYLLNEYSIKSGVPWIYGAVVGTIGRTAAFIPSITPCYHCLFPTAPTIGTMDTCDTVGVLAPISQMISSLQVGNVLKLLTGQQSAIKQELLQIDLWNNSFMPLQFEHAKRSDCPVCVKHRFKLLELVDYEQLIALCGRNSIQITPASMTALNLKQLAQQFHNYSTFLNRYLLRIHYSEQITLVVFEDGRCIIQGTDNMEYAKALYSKIFGL